MKGKPSLRKGVHLSPETKELMRKSRLGTKQSKETIEKRMVQIRGRKKPEGMMQKLLANISQESRLKGIEARKKPLLEFTKDGEFIMEHKGVAEAAKYHGVLRTSMSNYLVGKQPTFKGRVFIYKEKAKKCDSKISA
jgi:hypothetical protein